MPPAARPGPCRLDPDTLQTLGLEDFGGAVRLGLPFSTGLPWLDSAAGGLLTGLRAALTGRWTGWVRLGEPALPRQLPLEQAFALSCVGMIVPALSRLG
jgi:hypothetical protein